LASRFKASIERNGLSGFLGQVIPIDKLFLPRLFSANNSFGGKLFLNKFIK
jgi:hypothetical protein